MSRPSVARFALGLVVGVAVGFIAANTVGRPSSGPAAPATAPAAAPEAPEAAAERPAAPSDEISDEELGRAKAAVDARPDDFEAQFKFAEALLRVADRPRESIAYYTRAAALEPDDPKVQVGVGDANFATFLTEARAGTADPALLDAAAEGYERSLALDPKNATARAALGMTHMFRQPPRPDPAITDFRAALALEPKNLLAMQGLASALAAKGDLAAARRVLADLEAVAPNSPAVTQARADIERAAASKK